MHRVAYLLGLPTILACQTSRLPDDAGTNADATMQTDAGQDGDVIVPDGGCWDVVPMALCEYTGWSEVATTTPWGPGIQRYETIEARAYLCFREWRLRYCERSETLISADGGMTVKLFPGCVDTEFYGGLAILHCSETNTYIVGGNLRWQHITAWDAVSIVRD